MLPPQLQKNKICIWGVPWCAPNLLTEDMDSCLAPDSMRLALPLTLILALAACSPKATPTFFVAPTEPAPGVPSIQSSPAYAPTVIPVVATITASPEPCTDGLTYIQDLTVPDGTSFLPGQPIDKQWLISNSGTCNWNSNYRLKLVEGSNLGAVSEEALYPARAGTQATIHITFTAPPSPGTYRSAWQAFDPAGQAFGDQIFLQINVSP